MVKVVTAPMDWTAPLDEHYALVEIASSDAAFFDHPLCAGSVSFRVNDEAPIIANAIDKAVDWAKVNGAALVYVVRPARFAR